MLISPEHNALSTRVCWTLANASAHTAHFTTGLRSPPLAQFSCNKRTCQRKKKCRLFMSMFSHRVPFARRFRYGSFVATHLCSVIFAHLFTKHSHVKCSNASGDSARSPCWQVKIIALHTTKHIVGHNCPLPGSIASFNVQTHHDTPPAASMSE